MIAGIRNIIKWIPIIWYDIDFDWDPLAKIMEFKLRNMAESFRYNNHTVNCQDNAKDMLICAELLKRLREDNCDGVDIRTHDIRMREWDKMFGDRMKQIRWWWY